MLTFGQLHPQECLPDRLHEEAGSPGAVPSRFVLVLVQLGVLLLASELLVTDRTLVNVGRAGLACRTRPSSTGRSASGRSGPRNAAGTPESAASLRNGLNRLRSSHRQFDSVAGYVRPIRNGCAVNVINSICSRFLPIHSRAWALSQSTSQRTLTSTRSCSVQPRNRSETHRMHWPSDGAA